MEIIQNFLYQMMPHSINSIYIELLQLPFASPNASSGPRYLSTFCSLCLHIWTMPRQKQCNGKIKNRFFFFFNYTLKLISNTFRLAFQNVINFERRLHSGFRRTPGNGNFVRVLLYILVWIFIFWPIILCWPFHKNVWQSTKKHCSNSFRTAKPISVHKVFLFFFTK